MLGSIVQNLGAPGVAQAALIEAGELALLARVDDAASLLDTEPGELAAYIARRWLAVADDEAWLRLVSVIGRSQQPALAALVMMLEQGLAELDAKQATLGGQAGAHPFGPAS